MGKCKSILNTSGDIFSHLGSTGDFFNYGDPEVTEGKLWASGHWNTEMFWKWWQSGGGLFFGWGLLIFIFCLFVVYSTVFKFLLERSIKSELTRNNFTSYSFVFYLLPWKQTCYHRWYEICSSPTVPEFNLSQYLRYREPTWHRDQWTLSPFSSQEVLQSHLCTVIRLLCIDDHRSSSHCCWGLLALNSVLDEGDGHGRQWEGEMSDAKIRN